MHLRHQVCGAPDQRLIAADRREEVERIAEAHLQGEPQILDHAQILEQVVALERARHAHAADPVGEKPVMSRSFNKDAAGAGLELAADLIDQAGLAGAIRPDDDVALARRDGRG